LCALEAKIGEENPSGVAFPGAAEVDRGSGPFGPRRHFRTFRALMPVDFPVPGPATLKPVASSRAGGSGPAELYRERSGTGLIRADPAQERVVLKLQQLYDALLSYRPPARLGLLARLGGAARTSSAPRGLYLWGPVGRGKSMLMDLFFAAAPVANKRRVHFHAFMLEVHDRLEKERRAKTPEPVGKVAADLASGARLLCFDEFQVNDIADAMILERLFRALFDAGTIVVATSNRPPDRLYEGGLQRDRFLPFIALMQRRLDELELDSGRDYRLSRMMGKRVYHWPLDDWAHLALAAAFAELTDDMPGTSETLIVKERALIVPKSARNIAWFHFDELCARPLGPADYLAVAERFAAVILEGIPRLEPSRRNEAQRLHILIDALYEARTLIVASAAVPPEEIYPAGDGAADFRRTVSRLHEMQSEDYIANRAKR
jgi:cell division protein ZapE